MALAVHPRVAWQVLDGEAVLIDLERGNALGLNAAGSFLWQRLDGRNLEELAADLAAEFDVDREEARRDVAEFVERLRARGFVEG